MFDRLDSLRDMSKTFERANLDDFPLAALVQGSKGLLFPSFVEGFGLPQLRWGTWSADFIPLFYSIKRNTGRHTCLRKGF